MPTWKSNYDLISFVITATEISSNVNNNNSSVQVIAELRADRGSSGFNGYPQTLEIKVGNTVLASLTEITYNLNAGGVKSLGSWTTTVNRNTYPNAVVVRGEISDKGYLGDSGVTAVINQTLSLSTIQKASVPTLDKTALNFGETVRITTNRTNSSFTHLVSYSIGGVTTTISSNVGNYVDWTPTRSIAGNFPNALSGTVTITVTTFNGADVLGSNTVALTVNVNPADENFKPSVNQPVLAEKNTSISTNLPGMWLQSQSNINVSSTISTKYSASLVSGYVILNPGANQQRIMATVSENKIELNIRVQVSGTVNVAIEAVDSRGITTISPTTQINVLAYEPPRLSNVTANRSLDDPTTIIISALGTGSVLSDKNTLTLNAYIRQTGETSWNSSDRVVTNTSTNGEVSIDAQSFETYSEAMSFEVRVDLKDKVSGTQVSIVTIGTTSVLMAAYKDIGVGLGKLYEPEFNGDVQVGEDGLVSFGPISVENEKVMYVQRDAIQDGDDLNNYTESGIYTKSNGNVDNPVLNLPNGFSGINFMLQVIKLNSTATIQIAMQVSASVPTIINPMVIAVRNKYSNFWIPWTRITQEE